MKKNSNDTNFIKKFREDKKFKAKVELVIGFSFIFVLLIYANVTGVNSNYNYGNSLSSGDSNVEYESENETSLIYKINNNYEYETNVSLSKYTSLDNKDLVNYNYSYTGKVYDNNEIINKNNNNVTVNYAKVGDIYYLKENDNYVVSDKDTVYDLVDYKYLNIEDIRNYLKSAKLDHTTTYSNGNINYVYDLKVSDIINTYKGDKSINIEINEIDDNMIISIDYTDLINEIDNLISELKVNIKYSNINNVLNFNPLDH